MKRTGKLLRWIADKVDRPASDKSKPTERLFSGDSVELRGISCKLDLEPRASAQMWPDTHAEIQWRDMPWCSGGGNYL